MNPNPLHPTRGPHAVFCFVRQRKDKTTTTTTTMTMMTVRRCSLSSLGLAILLLTCRLRPNSAFIAGLFDRAPPSLEDELGLSPTWQAILQRDDVYFDPLGFADDDNFAYLREAELKHGRVAMLASIGMVVGPNQGRDVWELLQQYVLKDDMFPTRIVRDALIPQIGLGTKINKLSMDVLNPISFLQIMILCGFLETFVWVQLDPTDMPGDYGAGYFGVRNKGQNERSLVVELENGRLAMISSMVYLFIETNTGRRGIEQAFDALARFGSDPSRNIAA